jgi:hypothetical protein
MLYDFSALGSERCSRATADKTAQQGNKNRRRMTLQCNNWVRFANYR